MYEFEVSGLDFIDLGGWIGLDFVDLGGWIGLDFVDFTIFAGIKSLFFMYIGRHIDRELLAWRSIDNRQPLLIRGARQVGKSTAVRQLATHFEHYLELNFDERPEFVELFAQRLPLPELLEQLEVLTGVRIEDGKTLLFLDEIQACLPAISLLRYFYERRPELHVIAAGSLLEFALSEIPSFGVGRVRSVFMYPLSFLEFLGAMGESKLASAIQKGSAESPVPVLVHQKLVHLLKKYFIVGGMPAVVRSYVEKRSLLEIQGVLDQLIVSIQADFSKYNRRIPSERIRWVFESLVRQVGQKFKYSESHTELNAQQIRQVLELLQMAGLVHAVTHSSCNGIPMGAEANPQKRKYLVYDCGIFQRLLGQDTAALLAQDDFELINKGNLAELFVGLELLKYRSNADSTGLYYWLREAKNSQAEVDYVLQDQEVLVPIEVKAGTKGAMQSMHLFLKEKGYPKGVRLSLENFAQFDAIRVLPLYAVSRLGMR
jgi:predicted AAA+ superfamily ATPase